MPGAVGIKKEQSQFLKILKSKSCFSHRIPRDSKMIFNEK